MRAHNFHLSVETGKIRSQSCAFNPLPKLVCLVQRSEQIFIKGKKEGNCLLQLHLVRPLQSDRSKAPLRQEAASSPGSPAQSSSASNSLPICLYAA